MANNIFISYSRKDLAFVKKLHHQLITHGLSAWFDQTDIPPGDHWRETIVRAINGCNIFLLVLSPAAVKSKHVRTELNLAERYQKLIVPLVWQHATLPPSLEYQLVGIQYFEFNAQHATDSFARLANALQNVLKSPREKSLYLSTWQPRAVDTAEKYGRWVVAQVVTPLAINIIAQDKINAELHWLFAAAEHFIRVRRGETAPDAPVPVSIPSGAKTLPPASNRLRPTADSFSWRMAESRLVSLYKQIHTYLNNLTFEATQDAQMSDTSKNAVTRRNSIKTQRQLIVERLQRMAKILRELYGVSISAPDTLAHHLEMMQH